MLSMKIIEPSGLISTLHSNVVLLIIFHANENSLARLYSRNKDIRNIKWPSKLNNVARVHAQKQILHF